MGQLQIQTLLELPNLRACLSCRSSSFLSSRQHYHYWSAYIFSCFPYKSLQRDLEEEALQTVDPSDQTGMPHPVSAATQLPLHFCLHFTCSCRELLQLAQCRGCPQVRVHAEQAPLTQHSRPCCTDRRMQYHLTYLTPMPCCSPSHTAG